MKLSTLMTQFTVAVALACGVKEISAATPPDGHALKNSSHSVKHAHIPHGMRVLFRDFGNLPTGQDGMSLQEVFRNSKNAKDQSGEELYKSIADDQRTALLNTVQDMHRIHFLKDQSTLFEHVIEFRDYYQDGFSCKVDSTFVGLAADDPFMHYGNKLDKKLHPAPPGYDLVGNYKTHEPVPLHFTVYKSDTEYLVKFHNDRTRDGLRHMRDVVVHAVTGINTNPYEMGLRLERKLGVSLLYEVVREP